MRVFPKGGGHVGCLACCLRYRVAESLVRSGGRVACSRKLSFVAVFVIFLIQGWKLNLGRLKEAWVDLRILFFLHSFIFVVPGFVVLGIREIGLVDPIWTPGALFSRNLAYHHLELRRVYTLGGEVAPMRLLVTQPFPICSGCYGFLSSFFGVHSGASIHGARKTVCPPLSNFFLTFCSWFFFRF